MIRITRALVAEKVKKIKSHSEFYIFKKFSKKKLLKSVHFNAIKVRVNLGTR